MESPKLGSNRFYVVSLDIKGGSGADTISYTKLHANTIVNNYLQECRLRQVEGEVTLSCVKIENFIYLIRTARKCSLFFLHFLEKKVVKKFGHVEKLSYFCGVK